MFRRKLNVEIKEAEDKNKDIDSILRKIQKLEHAVTINIDMIKILSDKIEQLQNPPKFKKGDKVDVYQVIMFPDKEFMFSGTILNNPTYEKHIDRGHYWEYCILIDSKNETNYIEERNITLREGEDNA